jgi:hypothetical protein
MRQTRHGDYRKESTGSIEITVNSNLNKYKFLITLIHEFSHLVAFEEFGRKNLMVMMEVFFSTVNDSYIRQKFSSQLLPLLARHFKTNGQQ